MTSGDACGGVSPGATRALRRIMAEECCLGGESGLVLSVGSASLCHVVAKAETKLRWRKNFDTPLLGAPNVGFGAL